jgi:hypothetical protein
MLLKTAAARALVLNILGTAVMRPTSQDEVDPFDLIVAHIVSK